MGTKTILWILIGFFILINLSWVFNLGDNPTTEIKTSLSNVKSSLTGDVSTESVSIKKADEEETCNYGYSGKYRCNGNGIEAEWLSSDCSSRWFYYFTCNYGCENAECVYESIQDEEGTQEQSTFFKVTYIVDGDTLDVSTGERVRLICIDTPERGEYYYGEASDYLKSLTLNKEVDLVKDVSETDRYGRLLRYIYLKDGTFVNELLVENGYAKADPHSPDTTLCPQIQNVEDKAKNNNLGIWAEEEY